MNEESLVYRLRRRSEIRRSIAHRKSVQEGQPDRIADLLEEAATEIERLQQSLTVTDLQQALIDADIIDAYAVEDSEEYDDGMTLENIDKLHGIIQAHINGDSRS